MDAMMNYIFTNHQLVLSSYVVDELKNVVEEKVSRKRNDNQQITYDDEL